VIIGLGSSPDQSRQINHLLTGRSFGEGQAIIRGSDTAAHGENRLAGALNERIDPDNVVLGVDLEFSGVKQHVFDDVVDDPAERSGEVDDVLDLLQGRLLKALDLPAELVGQKQR